MSKMSEVLETALKHKHIKEVLDDMDKADEYLEKRAAEEDEPYKLPKLIYHTEVKIKEMFGRQVISFNENESSKDIILYLHGGAYINQIDSLQVSFCDKLAKKTKATIFAPLYPLAPNHTYKETYQFVEKLYEWILEFEKPVTVMGDSAGGGLTAAFCEYLANNQIELPKQLILISPWVDVSMSGDYEKYRDLDPMLGIEALPKVGEAWSGDFYTKYYKVSPLFVNVEKLPPTKIFVGTHEVFYPDILAFYNKLKDYDVDVELFVGEEMPHVYPIYPVIPESKEGFNEIVDIILDDS